MKNFSKKFLASLLCLCLILSVCSITAAATDTDTALETIPEGLTNITFRDFGFDDGTYKGSSTGLVEDLGYYGGSSTSGKSLDGTLLSGKVTFGNVGGAGWLAITPKGTWEGALVLCQRDSEDKNCLYLRRSNASRGTTAIATLTPEVAGVQLTGAELDLQLSFQLVDNDGDGATDDLKLGIWFNGVLYNNEYFYIDDSPVVKSDVPSRIALVRNFAADSITVESTKQETIPEGLINTTFRDFNIADGTYTGAGEDLGYYKGTSIDGTLFSGKVTFDKVGGAGWLVFTPYGTWEKALVLAQRDNENHEYLYLRTYSGGGTSPIATLTPEVAGVQLTGVELDLQLSFQLVDNDGDGATDDLKLGIWFSGVLYNNEYFYIDDSPVVKADAKSRIALFRNAATDSITVKSTERETPPVDLKNITFRDFGFADGTYTGAGEDLGYYSGTSIDGTLFSGKVTFDKVGGAGWLVFTPYGTWEKALVLAQRDNENHEYLYLRTYSGGGTSPIATLTPEVAGVQLTGAELDLQMSFQLVDNDGDGATDDLKLGIWFSGVLYNNEYFYINDCPVVKADAKSRIALFRNAATDSITVQSTAIETLPVGLKNITFRDCEYPDGTYTYGDNWRGYDGSLDGTILSGKVTFGNVGGAAEIWIIPDDSTSGMKLRQRDAGNHASLYLDLPGIGTLELKPEIAGMTTLTGVELDLKMSFQLVDNDGDGATDDLKLGIWFSKVLYNNAYFYVNDCTFVKSDESSRMVFNRNNFANDYIKIVNPAIETMPVGLTDITFRDFGFADGSYVQGADYGGYYTGSSIDGTMFSGKVTFDIHGGAAQFLITPVGTWTGAMALRQRDAGNPDSLYLSLPGSSLLEIKSDIAGVTLTGVEVDLQMSFQLVDNDGDGVTDDLKLGLWFNKVLYNNEYFYINDCPFVKADAKSRIILYPESAGNSITVASKVVTDPYYVYDFSAAPEWKKLGDGADINSFTVSNQMLAFSHAAGTATGTQEALVDCSNFYASSYVASVVVTSHPQLSADGVVAEYPLTGLQLNGHSFCIIPSAAQDGSFQYAVNIGGGDTGAQLENFAYPGGATVDANGVVTYEIAVKVTPSATAGEVVYTLYVDGYEVSTFTGTDTKSTFGVLCANRTVTVGEAEIATPAVEVYFDDLRIDRVKTVETNAFGYKQVRLNADLGLDIKVATDNAAYAVITVGGVSKTVALADLERNVKLVPVDDSNVPVWNSWYVVTVDVPVKDIFETVTVQLLDADKNPVSSAVQVSDWSVVENGVFSYTIEEYATGLLTDATYGAAAQALLDYGMAAKDYFAARDSETYEATLTAEAQARLDAVTAAMLNNYAPAKGDLTAVDGIKFYGSSLVVESNTRIRHYYLLTDADAWENAAVTVDVEGATYHKDVSGSFGYVEITGVHAADLETTYTVTLTGNGETIEVTYSGLSYAWTTLNPPEGYTVTNEQTNLAKGLFLYWQAADALAQAQ